MSGINFLSSPKEGMFSKSISETIGFEGGTIRFKEAEVEREISVNDNFYDSYRNKNIKFTNHIHKTNNDIFLKPVRNLLKSSLEVFKSNRQVTFDSYNKKRLHEILDYYIKDTIKKDREEKLFKIHPVSEEALGIISETVRVYLLIDTNPNVKTTYTLIFIDLYHLAIPSKKGQKSAQVMLEESYGKYKILDMHIKDVIKEEATSFMM